MLKNEFGFISFGDDTEASRRASIVDLLKTCPIPDAELLYNIGLFLTPQTLGRILFMDFLFRQITTVQGIVMEFGCRWGQNLALLTALRGIYEPFNRLRTIVAFDTFAGFPSVKPIDGEFMQTGAFGTSPDYDAFLAKLITLQEAESPLPHLVKHQIVKGDVSETVPRWVAANPHAVVALAYFDLDIYEPTKNALNAIRGRLTKGSVLAFDEVNEAACPGETAAIAEVFGLDAYNLQRFPASARTTYLVVQ